MGHQASLIICSLVPGQRSQARSGDHGLRQSDNAGFDVDGEHDVAWVRARAPVAAIRSGNVQMFFPERNLLIQAGEREASGFPDYTAVVEVLPAS
jgi:hypothetical protein